MKFIANNKFFARYLPMFLSVVIIVGAVFTYQIFNSTTKVAEAGWYNTGGTWGYRKPITIDRDKVNTATGTTTPLTNFPVLISVTDSDLIYSGFGGKVGKADGTDILFTSADGTTKLNHEIESYSSSTGTTIIWVQVPSLAKTSDTVLYIYFGNAGASDQQNKTGVWDSNYKAVYHFVDGSTLSASDSTSNGNNGTITGVGATIGKIDGAADFNTAGNKVVANSVSSQIQTGDVTFSAWIKLPTAYTTGSNFMIIGRNGDSPSNNDIHLTLGDWGNTSTTGKLHMQYYNGSAYPSAASNTSSWAANTWYFVTGTYSLTDGVKVYVNGSIDGSAAATARGTTPYATNFQIGNAVNGPTSYFTGVIDDFRVSSTARSSDWIITEYNNQSSPATFYSYGSLGVQNRSSDTASEGFKNRGASGNSWYNASWGYRKQITIDHNKVSGVASSTLNNFPLLFSVTDSDLKYTGSGGKTGKSDGTDMLFTSADGTTKLNHELEKYASTTGETIAWVKIPVLSAVADTTIYIYFGNSGASDQQNKTGTWDSNYQGVWHLPNGSTLTAADSTSNARNGTLVNTPTAGVGQINGAAAFAGPGPNQYIDTGVNSGLNGVTTATLSGWMYRTNGSNFVSFGQSFTNYRFNIEWYNDGNLYFQPENGAQSFPSFATPQTVGWHYITCTFNGALSGMSRVACYWDGNQQTLAQGFGGLPPSSLASAVNQHAFYIGQGNSYTTGNIDEVRVSNSIRSADWVATEYNNQSSPAAFYAYGAVSVNGRQTSGGSAAPAIKIRGGVKFK